MAPVVPIVAAAAGAAATSAGVFGATLLGSTLFATVANSAVGFVVSTAVNQLGSRALSKKPKAQAFTQEAQGRTFMVRSSVETHKLIYGTAKVSGPLIYVATANDGQAPGSPPKDNKMLYMVIPVAGHEVEDITHFYLNDQLVTLDGSLQVISSPYYPNSTVFARFGKNLGTTSQVADTFLVADAPGWTDDHRGRGIAYIWARFEYNADVFPLGTPNVSCIVKGKKVYDPRTGLTAWSANSALCVRDYLLNECDVVTARFDDSYTTAAANICDEDVTLSTGGTQDRYTCNGIIDTGVPRRDNLTALLSSMAGEVVRVGDKVRIFAGAFDSTAGAVTDDMLAGELTIRARTPRADLTNTVRGTFVDPNKNYQPTDFPPITNSTYVTQDAGIAYSKDLDLPFTNHPEAAQRIAKVILEKARQGITVDMPLNHSALKYATWDTITYTQSHLGWSSKVFRIKSMKMADVPAGAFRLTLQEESSASYDWNSGEAETIDAAPDTNLPVATTVQPPGNPVLTETLYSTTDGSGVKAKATVSWSASPDAFAREYQVEYKLAADSTYITAGRTAGTSLDIFDIAPGTYDLRVKTINSLGVSSEYAPNTAKVKGLTDPPADITGFSLNAINNNAHLSWSQAGDLDVKVGGSIRIRHTPLTSGVSWSSAIDLGPALSGTATAAVLPLLDGTYLIKAVDSVGNESVNATTVTSTVANIVKMNTVATSTQHSSFAGTKTNLAVVGSDLFDSTEDFDSSVMFDDGVGDAVLRLDSGDLFDSDDDFDSDEFFDAGLTYGYATSGVYYFATYVDIGKVATSRVTATLDASIYDGLGTFDSSDEFDGPGLFDGDDETAIEIKLYVRTTNDDPAATPTWSDWRQFFVGDYTCRAYEFKLEITSSNNTYNADIRQLAVTVDMPDVVDQGSLTTGTGGRTTVSYNRTFVIAPKIGTTVKNGATGDFIDLQNATATGFEIGVKNSGGSYVARDVDWLSRGY